MLLSLCVLEVVNLAYSTAIRKPPITSFRRAIAKGFGSYFLIRVFPGQYSPRDAGHTVRIRQS